jgi:hypothetical protein
MEIDVLISKSKSSLDSNPINASASAIVRYAGILARGSLVYALPDRISLL